MKISIVFLFFITSLHLNAQIKNDKYSFDSLISNYSPDLVFKYLALNHLFKKNIGIDSVIENYQKCFEEFAKDSGNRNVVKKALQSYKQDINRKNNNEIEGIQKFCYIDKLISTMPIFVKDNNEDILPFSLFEGNKGIDKIIYNKLRERPYSSMASCESSELYNDILIYISKQKHKKYMEMLSLIFKKYSQLLPD